MIRHKKDCPVTSLSEKYMLIGAILWRLLLDSTGGIVSITRDKYCYTVLF